MAINIPGAWTNSDVRSMLRSVVSLYTGTHYPEDFSPHHLTDFRC